MARSPAGVEHLELENLSAGQLRDLIRQAKETLNRRIQGQMDEFRALAREAGFEVSLTRIGEGEGEGRRGRRRASHGIAGEGDDRRRAVHPKYQNPDNPTDTWSGRGRKPKWIEDQLASGKSLDALVIRSRHLEQAQEEIA
jgi:DNA-binding protein H-NS